MFDRRVVNKHLKRGAAMLGAAVLGSSKPKPKYQKRMYKRVKRVKGKGIKRIRKELAQIKNTMKEGQTTLKYRVRNTASILAAGDNMTRNSAYGFDFSDILACLSKLQQYDVATSSFVTNDFFGGSTASRSVDLKYVSELLEFKNNYQVPVKVTCYLAKPKVDNSNDIIADFNASIGRNVINTLSPPAEYNPLVQFSDGQEVNSVWSVKKVKDFFLEPGQVGHVFHSEKDITVERTGPTLSFQRRYKNFQWVIEVTGGLHNLSHNNDDATKVGTGRCGIDLSRTMKINVEYDGGMTAERIYVDFSKTIDDLKATVSSRPVADNIAYSVN